MALYVDTSALLKRYVEGGALSRLRGFGCVRLLDYQEAESLGFRATRPGIRTNMSHLGESLSLAITLQLLERSKTMRLAEPGTVYPNGALAGRAKAKGVVFKQL